MSVAAESSFPSPGRRVLKHRNFGYVPDLLQWLDDNGIPWTYEKDVPMGQITKEAASQARIMPKGEDAKFVRRYRSLMKAAGGRLDKFPPLVLWADGFDEDGKVIYRILDGNHRFVAAKEEELTSVDAIVVDAPSEEMAIVI